MAATANKRDVLAGHAFFRDLPSATIERLATYAHSFLAAKGTTVFSKGDPGHGLLAVLSGIVKISSSSEEGKEIVFNLIGQGEVFGEIALLDGGPRTATATALTDCVLLALDRRDFMPLLMADPTMAAKLLEIVSGRLRRTSEQIEDTAFLELPARLARAILRLAEVQGGAAESPWRIAITQRELGDMVGRTRESINRQLRAWETEGLVRLETGGVRVVAPARLMRLAGEPAAE